MARRAVGRSAGDTPPHTLVLGYGNPGRQDDGLGPACAGRIAALALPGVRVEINYQLTVEDALTLGAFARVMFVDAVVDGEAPFAVAPVRPDERCTIGSHSLSPQAVVTLAHTLYGTQIDARVIGIRGYAFDEFEEALSASAKRNLDQAVAFLQSWL
jgi:hydrogenase maturation protease